MENVSEEMRPGMGREEQGGDMDSQLGVMVVE